MGKSNYDNTLKGQRASRPLLAISLAASLAAFGCTTNYNPGNGTPDRTPEVRTAPTAGVTGGGETTSPPVDPPMTSSYARPDALPNVSQRSIRRNAADAAAIMADNQPSGGRYLGIVSPGAPARGYQSDRIATFVPPAQFTNPQQTLNATISSDPTSAVNSVTAVDGTGVTAGATVGGVTITGTGDVSPTTATTTTVTPGQVAGTNTLPTVASANTPSVTAASAGLGRTTATGTTRAATTTTPTSATTTATTTTAPGTVRGGLSPVVIQRGTNGVTVTNVGTTTSTGRGQ